MTVHGVRALSAWQHGIPWNITNAVSLPSESIHPHRVVLSPVDRTVTMAWFGDTQVALPGQFPVHPSIGPIADLPIINAVVSPDGFARS